MKSFRLKILYCKPCSFENQAKRLAADLQSQFYGNIEILEIEPTNKIGGFEIFLNDELIFSKLDKGNLPQPGDIEQIIMKKIVSTNG